MTAGPRVSPRERIDTALAHREPDRVPIVVTSREFAIRYSRFTFADIWADGTRYVDAQVRLVTDFQLDAVWDLWCTPAVDEALGAPMERPADDPPWMPTACVVEKEDLRKLPRALDPHRDGRMPFLLSIVRALKATLGPEVPLVAWVSPPFRTACMLRGTDQLYMDMLLDPGFVHELVERVSGPCTEYGQALVDAGADIIATSNPVANHDCISLAHYEEFSHPYSKRMFAAIKTRGDVRGLFHTCGNWDDRFHLVTAENIDIVHVDKVDLASFKQRWGDRVTVMGNVRSVDTMLQGTPERVEAEARACIEMASKAGGYFLSADCTLPRDTPKENLAALVRAGRT